MAFGTGFFAGVAAAPEGYQAGKRAQSENDLRRAQALEAQNDVMGQAAFGRALQLMYGGGGAQAPQGPGGGAGAPPGMDAPRPPADIPQAGPQGGPQPGGQPLSTDQLTGQPSPMGGVSNSRFNQTFMQPLLPPQQQGQPPAPPAQNIPAGQQPSTGQIGQPGAFPPQMQQRFGTWMNPPQGRGATMPAGPQQAPPTGGPTGSPTPQPQGQGQQGVLTLDNVMKMMVAANPGAPPAVIAAGVNRFLPLMNAQSQQQWKEISLSLRQQALENQEDRFRTGEARRQQQGDERIGISRDREDRSRDQGGQRIDLARDREQRVGQQGQQRIDLARDREGRQSRQGDRRLDQADTREQRQAADSAARRDLIKEKLTQQQRDSVAKQLMNDAKIKKLQADADKAVGSKDIATARLRLSAMHLRAQELINQWALDGKIDKKVLAAVIEENRLLYKNMIEELGRGGKSDKGDLAPGESRVEPAGKAGDKPRQLRIDPASGQVSPQ